MFTSGHRTKVALAVATGITSSVGIAILCRRMASKFVDSLTIRSQEAQTVVERMDIKVAKTEQQSTELVKAILSDMKEERVIGFDCEWVQKEKRKPVALLQLASQGGLCALFQLCMLPQVPDSLKDLLEDRSILKVGLDPLTDANHLLADYGINVVGTVDLRYLSRAFPKMGLASIVQRELGMSLSKYKWIRTSDWERSDLAPDQLQYAAKDALLSLLVFNKLILKQVEFPFFASKEHAWNLIYDHCAKVIDQRFREKSISNDPSWKPSRPAQPLERNPSGMPNGTTLDPNKKNSFKAYSSRKAPLYDNCLLLAPDGEVLSTCDIKKADWYVSKGLASVESMNPYKVRLLFEPSGRASGVSGQYYVQEKENQCVVCGRKDSYLRKKVVPHEYRKYFPDSMKNHQSHDILLLCTPCHLRSNTYDLALRVDLGKRCNAPLHTDDNMKVTEDRKRKRLRSAARALLNCDKLPEVRRKELTDIILENYSEVTPQLLDNLKDIDVCVVNEDYAPHGLLVVEHFVKQHTDGLRQFEKLWRQHFLKTMKPNFLPPFWSVDHYHEDETRYQLDPAFISRVKSFSCI